MKNINLLRNLYHLKNVERNITVKNRKESPAEHSWSCLILADYFLAKIKDIDRLKVYELLMYHDLVEIETGDTCISKVKERENKKEVEQEALRILKNKIPLELKDKFVNLFTEFEEQKTREAKFAKAVDALDAEIHLLDYKDDWKGWTEGFVRKCKEHLFEEFPEMKEVFEKVTVYIREQGFFDQVT